MYNLLGYKKCSTCRDVEKLLNTLSLEYKFRDIIEDKLSIDEIKTLHKKSGLELKRFFNTSGILYRELKLASKLKSMSEEEQYKLLSTDGKLIKRPMLIFDDKILVGADVKKYLNNTKFE